MGFFCEGGEEQYLSLDWFHIKDTMGENSTPGLKGTFIPHHQSISEKGQVHIWRFPIGCLRDKEPRWSLELQVQAWKGAMPGTK